MYKCCDCGLVFDTPKHYSEDRTPGGAFEGGSFIYHYDGCPSCGGAYEEAIECQRCADTYVSIDSDYPFCDKCKTKLMKAFAFHLNDTYRFDESEYILDHLDDLKIVDNKYVYKKGE